MGILQDILDKITNIKSLKQTLFNKLLTMYLVEYGATLEDCVNAVNRMPYYGEVIQYNLSTKDQLHRIEKGYYGGSYTVGIDALQQQRIIPENIKKGVSILGVAGELNAGDIAALLDRSITTLENDEVTSLGAYAFAGCSNLYRINLERVTSVGAYAFRDCIVLYDVNLPSVQTLGQYAFYGCSELFTFSSDTLTNIGNFAFYECSGLSIFEALAVETLGSNAFSGCTSLTDVNFPMLGNTGWTSAFEDCTGLTMAAIPNVSKIPNSAFSGCTSLTDVYADSAETIDMYAFENCSSLASIELPYATLIKNHAFRNCTSLTELILPGDTMCNYEGSTVFYNTPIANGTGKIKVNANLLNSYKTYWHEYESQIEAI